MRHVSLASSVIAASVVLVSQAHAQVTLGSLFRKVDVGASYTGFGTPNESPSTAITTTSPGVFAQTTSISTTSGLSTGSAKQNTTIGASRMFGTGSATALVQEKPNADATIYGRGLSTLTSSFSLTAPLRISLDAWIPSVTQTRPLLVGTPRSAAYVQLLDSTTNTVLARVSAVLNIDNTYNIGAPIHFQAILPAGSYTLLATAEMAGFGTLGPNGLWTGSSSFQFDLWIPSPGAAGLLLTALVPMSTRRRR